MSDFSLCVWCFINIKGIIHPKIKKIVLFLSLSVVHRNPMTTSTPLTVRPLMTKQSYPGPTNSTAGGAYVCNGNSSGSGGSHGCTSPGSLLLSYGCPLHLEHMNHSFCQMVRSAATSSRSSGLILHFFKAFFI